MPRPPFPRTLRQFQSDFATEEACQQYLAACRWPEGFTCPRCRHGKAYQLVKQTRRQCCNCRYQVSLTIGTVLHRTKIPLTCWFWAAYLMTTDKRGFLPCYWQPSSASTQGNSSPGTNGLPSASILVQIGIRTQWAFPDRSNDGPD